MISRRSQMFGGGALLLILLLSGGACAHGRAASGEEAAQALGKARVAAEAGRWTEASKAFEAAIRHDRRLLDAHRGWVEAGLRTGRLAAVEEVYHRNLRADPNDGASLYGLALTRYAASTANADEALTLLERAGRALPDQSDIPFRRGIILLDAERWTLAREALEAAVSLGPRISRYRVPYALALFHSGDHAASIEALRELTELAPTTAEVRKAREVVERITDPFRHFPAVARGRVERAIAWLEQADVPQNAIDLLRQALEEHPETAMLHALLGLAYQRLDNGGEALVELRRAVELAPELPQPHLYLANFLHGRERYEDARAEYLAALERNPLLVEAHMMLGSLALEGGDMATATRHLRAWALLSPDEVRPRLDLARALAGNGDVGGAQEALREALAIDAGNLEANLSMGALLVRRHQLAKERGEREALAREARPHLEIVLDAQPENTAALRLLEALDR